MSAELEGEVESGDDHGARRVRMRRAGQNPAKRQRGGRWLREEWAIVPFRPPVFPFSVLMAKFLPKQSEMPQPVARRNCPPGFRINGTKVGPPPPPRDSVEKQKDERGKAPAKEMSKNARATIILTDSDEEESGTPNAQKYAAGASSSGGPSKKSKHAKAEEEKKKQHHAKKKQKQKNEVGKFKGAHTFNAKAPELGDESTPRTRVKYVLRSFDDLRRQYMLDEQKRSSKEAGPRRPDLNAYKAFGDFRVNGRKSIIGAVKGVEVGDHYYFRMELLLISLHRQSQGGIDFIPESKSDTRDSQGRVVSVAVSVIASGGYEDDRDEGNVLMYTGSGGNVSKNSSKPAADQELVRGNLGLRNSHKLGIPVRVIRGFETKKSARYPAPSTKVYVYDGLYSVESAKLVPGAQGIKVWQFKLVRRPGQGPQTSLVLFKGSYEPRVLAGLGEELLEEDISRGREPFKIRRFGIRGDAAQLDPFAYITELSFAPGVTKPAPECGCGCFGLCLTEKSCCCVYLGDGTDNYNEEGCLLIAKKVVYECGPFCQCNERRDKCTNRVAQNGLRYEMEVFQTKHKGWGVRSRQFITQGSFICEYIGQIISDRDAESRVARDDYMFDLTVPSDMESRFGLADIGRRKGFSKLEDEDESDNGKFTVDARQCGNLARFINHSCDPNLFVQCVFHDHHDIRMPHIMLFAAEHISPFVELTYDYGYIVDKVTVNGETKVKHCYCGGKNCIGRLY